MDPGQVDSVCVRKGLPEELRAADHEPLRIIGGHGQRFDERVGDAASLGLVVRLAGHHDVEAVREGPANRFERLPSHDHRMPPGEPLEAA